MPKTTKTELAALKHLVGEHGPYSLSFSIGRALLAALIDDAEWLHRVADEPRPVMSFDYRVSQAELVKGYQGTPEQASTVSMDSTVIGSGCVSAGISRLPPCAGDVFKHVKDGLYEVVLVATQVQDDNIVAAPQAQVVYKRLLSNSGGLPDGEFFVQTMARFMGMHLSGKHRFEFVGSLTAPTPPPKAED